jgi:hypothetical protein
MEVYGAVLQSQPVDVSGEFARQDNHFFIGSKVSEFDPRSASGRILWKGRALKQRVSYHQLTLQFEDYNVWEDLPPGQYEDDQDFSFSLSFVTLRTVRLRVAARPRPSSDEPSLMLAGVPPTDARQGRRGDTVHPARAVHGSDGLGRDGSGGLRHRLLRRRSVLPP